MRILEIAYEYSKIIELRLSNSQFTPEEMKKAYEADTSNLIQLVLLYEKFYRSYDLMRDDPDIIKEINFRRDIFLRVAPDVAKRFPKL